LNPVYFDRPKGTTLRYLKGYRLSLSKINIASRGLLLEIISCHPYLEGNHEVY
jgi:hypothetical protein